LIFLLSAPPGTGKTLTAEAGKSQSPGIILISFTVADKSHRPFYYLQAEDLDINAALLGTNVKKVFEMATELNAVILLDGKHHLRILETYR
jgi:SpoVK/Ycf46/Vps4 family AAA+-type ATPase